MKRIYSLCLCLALSLISLDGRAEVRIDDMRGNTLVLPAPAQRIVSLAPFLTELVYAAGAGDRLVGVVAHSDYPPQAAELPTVGDYKKIDLETVLALEPDVILAWDSGNQSAQMTRLRDLGLPVFVAEPRKLDDIAVLLERIGALAGTRTIADRAASDFRSRLNALRRKYAGSTPVSVFYEVWHQPLMTINGEHIISAVIRLCGGRNVFSDLPRLAAQVGLEAVLDADPQAIVASGMNAARPGWLDDWQRWSQLRAVRNGHLFSIPPDLIQRHSPRILDGAERLCRQLQLVRRSDMSDTSNRKGD